MSEKILDRITKLLKKADSTDSEHEREALNSKVEELMIRHGIEEAAIQLKMKDTPDPKDPLIYRVVTVSGTFARPMATMGFQIAEGLSTVKVYLGQVKAVGERVYVFGYTSDIDAFVALWRSLQMQATREVNEWAKTNTYFKSLQPHRKNVEKRTFLDAYSSRVRQRLTEIRNQVVQDMTAEGIVGAELALRSKVDQADELAHRQFTVGKARGGNRTWGSGLADGAGRAAGDRADVGQKAVK